MRYIITAVALLVGLTVSASAQSHPEKIINSLESESARLCKDEACRAEFDTAKLQVMGIDSKVMNLRFQHRFGIITKEEGERQLDAAFDDLQKTIAELRQKYGK
jgi:hypothetical protein